MTAERERIIKKYANRRLYDTEASKYITLKDLKKLIAHDVEVKVIDANTKQDITTEILLQVVIEQDFGATNIFTQPLLKQLIKFSESPVAHMISHHLEAGLNMLQQTQEKARHTWQDFSHTNANANTHANMGAGMHSPLDAFQNLSKQGVSLWQQSMEQMMNMFQGGAPDSAQDEIKSNSRKKK